VTFAQVGQGPPRAVELLLLLLVMMTLNILTLMALDG
jgi:hypothetical protein